jgi:hypothetical protein
VQSRRVSEATRAMRKSLANKPRWDGRIVSKSKTEHNDRVSHLVQLTSTYSSILLSFISRQAVHIPSKTLKKFIVEINNDLDANRI